MADNKIIDLDRLKDYAQKTHAKEVNDAYNYHGMAYEGLRTVTFNSWIVDNTWGEWDNGVADTGLDAYTIVFDGTPYPDVPIVRGKWVYYGQPDDSTDTLSSDSIWYLGDIKLQEYPFYIQVFRGYYPTDFFDVVSAAPGEHTIKIGAADERTIEIIENAGYYDANLDRDASLKEWHVGEHMDVVFDDVEYQLECQQSSDGRLLFGNRSIYEGDPAHPEYDTGEPLCLTQYPGYPQLDILCKENGRHTLTYPCTLAISKDVLWSITMDFKALRSVSVGSGKALAQSSLAFGVGTASGEYSMAGGFYSEATAQGSVAFGSNTKSTAYDSIVGGYQSEATGDYSVAFGGKTKASGFASNAEGRETKASGAYSHAEGYGTTASGQDSHAAGRGTTASGSESHAEGHSTKATSNRAHAEGYSTTASGADSHAEGNTSTASGTASHAEGGATAASSFQHAQGKYNVVDSASKYADIVGWGTSNSDKKNIEATTITGDKKMKGDVYVGANDDSSGGIRLSTPDVLAAYFDASTAYTAGSYVTNKDDGCLYKAKADITAGAWDASKWDKITVAQAIATGSAASDEVSEINLDGRALEVIDDGEFYAASATVEDALQALPGITCAAFDKAKVYNVGDFVIKDGALYKANAAHAAGEVFIPTKWDKTTIVENLGAGEYATKEDVDNAFDDIFGL